MSLSRLKGSAEAEIRAIIEDWAKAICAKDINRRVANYASDAMLFDVVNPLQYSGLGTIRKGGQEWFSSFQGPLEFETRELSVESPATMWHSRIASTASRGPRRTDRT